MSWIPLELLLPFVLASSASPSTPAPIPSERSAVPTAVEWKSALEVPLSRTSPRAAGCRASRVREWLRVHCDAQTFAISLLGGSSEGLSFWIGAESAGRFGEVQFPLRVGDRRVVQLWKLGPTSDGNTGPRPFLVLQEHWSKRAPAPTITLL